MNNQKNPKKQPEEQTHMAYSHGHDSNIHDKIEKLLHINHNYREPLKQIIIYMLDKYTCLNGVNIERHILGNIHCKLNKIQSYNQMS